MAWNEPGGNGKQRDPWGGGDQGPPDLDEALRKFRQKLGGVFGGGSGGNRRGTENAAAGVFGLVVLLLGALWWFMGVNMIDERERAVVLRFGKFNEILDPGFNWNPWLIDFVVPVSVTTERQYESRSLMLTEDEAIVELPIKVQYNIADVKAFVLNVDQPEISLGHATDSALRNVVGSSRLDDALSEGRAAIGDEVRQKLQTYLDAYGTGIQVVNVTIQEAKPPPEVKSAFDDVIKAREDEERLKNEAYAYANGIVPESRGRAQRQLEEAAAYKGKVVAEAEGEAQRFEKLLDEYRKAPEVTRERLYLDAIGRVYARSNKVLVDVSSGNNLIYLPVDRLGARGTSAATPDLRQAQPADVNQVADEVMERLRREAQATRARERR